MPARVDTITMPKWEVLDGKTQARVAKQKAKKKEAKQTDRFALVQWPKGPIV